MSEITERAARKLAEHYMVDPDTCWRSYESAVRVVIEELRVPTEAMERAGLRENAIQGAAVWFKPAWQAMIDAALASPSVEPKEI